MAATAYSDPEAYLCSRKFSQTIRCSRTGKKVSYADIGDPNGIPLLWLMPSGCSRWFAVPQDPLASRYGVRIIAVDRPGTGASERVPLGERIEISAKMIASVLDHLSLKPRHIIAHSAGIYHALHLLIHHLDSFDTSPTHPWPFVYLVAPWSPILPTSHPEFYASYLSLIPSKLIETQHVTLPHLIPALRTASTAWTQTTSAISSGWSFARSAVSAFTSGEASSSSSQATIRSPLTDSATPDAGRGEPSGDKSHDAEKHHSEIVVPASIPDKPTTDIDNPDQAGNDGLDEEEEQGEYRPRRMWGDFPCCLDCDFVGAEDFQGVGQEHLLCLNRGEDDTGYRWFEGSIAELAGRVRLRSPTPDLRSDVTSTTEEKGAEGDGKAGGVDERIHVHIWWGSEDKMVPVAGQKWLNKALRQYPDEIKLTEHRVEDADHADLLGRVEGIYQVYSLIQRRDGVGSEAEVGDVGGVDE